MRSHAQLSHFQLGHDWMVKGVWRGWSEGRIELKTLLM